MAMGGFTGVPLIAMALVTLLSARIAVNRIIAKGRSAVADASLVPSASASRWAA